MASHVTPAGPEVELGHVTPTGPEMEAGHWTPAKMEVARLVPSLNPAGTIVARGLMSLMGTTCVGLGGSRVWQGRVTCPPGGSRDTCRTGSWDRSTDFCRSQMWVVHVTPSELEVLPGHVTPTEMEVRGRTRDSEEPELGVDHVNLAKPECGCSSRVPR